MDMPSELCRKFLPPHSCLIWLYNECFVPLPAPGSTSWKSHRVSSSGFWDVLGHGSSRDCHLNEAAAAVVLTLGNVHFSILSQSLMLNSPFQSFNRFLGEEEVEEEVSLFACVPLSARLASGTKPTI